MVGIVFCISSQFYACILYEHEKKLLYIIKMDVNVLPSDLLSIVLEEPNKNRCLDKTKVITRLVSDSVIITPVQPNSHRENKINGKYSSSECPFSQPKNTTKLSVKNNKLNIFKQFPPALLKECIVEIINNSQTKKTKKTRKVKNGSIRRKSRLKSTKVEKHADEEIDLPDIITNVEAVYSDGGEDIISNDYKDRNDGGYFYEDDNNNDDDDDDDDDSYGRLVIDESRDDGQYDVVVENQSGRQSAETIVRTGSSGSINEAVSPSADSTLTYACDYCPNKYNNKGALWQHSVAAHSVEKTCECQLCGRKFYRNCSLALHMKCHTDEQQCSCNVCGKEFSRLSLLEKHSKFHHADDETPQYACKVCDKKFADQANLQRHASYHNDKYSCDMCNVTFNRKQLLQLHFVMTHNGGQKLFICKICKTRFGNQKDLIQHTRSHYNNNNNNSSSSSNGNRSSISCQYCSETFVQRSLYKKHLQLHVGDRLRCDICRIDFTQRSSLLRHLKKLHGINTSHLGNMNVIRETIMKNGAYVNVISARKSKKNNYISNNKSNSNNNNNNSNNIFERKNARKAYKKSTHVKKNFNSSNNNNNNSSSSSSKSSASSNNSQITDTIDSRCNSLTYDDNYDNRKLNAYHFPAQVHTVSA